MDKLYSVGELAKAGGTTPRAVHLYVDKGLLNPIRVGRIICFPDTEALALDNIQRAKRLGFSLDEIGACRTGRNPDAIGKAISRIETLKSDANTALAGLRRRLKDISRRT